MATKIEKITILKVSDLPPSEREKFQDMSGFVEVRVTRNSPPITEIRKLEEKPLTCIRNALSREGVLGINLDE